MSSQPDNSDDLIAELAKLMATNAKGESSGAKPAAPSPLSLAPAAPAGAKPVVRIPGLDMPPLSVVPLDSAPRADGSSRPSSYEYKPMVPPPSQAKPGAPVSIRIPGMDQPVAAAPTPAAKSPEPIKAAEPAKLSSAPPIATVSSPRITTFSSAPEIKPETRGTPTVTPIRPLSSESKPAATRIEPVLAPVPAPSQPAAKAPEPVAKEPVKDESGTSDFDFGFGTKDEAKQQSKDAPKTSYDPIADIIAAEEAPAAPQSTKPVLVQVTASAPKPATVTPVAAPPPRQAQAAQSAKAAPVALKPGFGTKPVPAENDKFFVAPVFGLGNKVPIAAEPKPTSTARRTDDPMDEIENLIGEAVRVDSEREASERPEQPRPIVPPLTTNFAPRRSGLKDEPDTAPQSAEAAILAAAAATGAEVGRIEPPKADDKSGRRRTKYKPKPTRRASGGARQYVGIAVAGTLLLAAGFGLYWVLNMGRGDPATAPTLTADASPTKQVPAVAAAVETHSPVLDQIDGVATPPDQETLVSRDDTTSEDVTDVAAIDSEATDSGLANRKVRTVTVRPDGTIVAADDSVAGAEPLPVDRPDVPAVPGQAISPSDLLTAATDSVSSDPIAALVAESNPDAATPAAAPAETGAPAAIDVATAQTPAVDPGAVAPLALVPPGATVTPSDVIAPAPKPRPLNREALNGNPSRSVTAVMQPDTQPTATANNSNSGLAMTANGQQIDLLAQPLPVAADPPQQVAAAAPQTDTPSAYVQLSAQRDEATARSDAKNFNGRFASLFGSSQVEIHRVDLGSKGIWYRVLIPTNSKGAAASMCQDIKSAGGDCIVH